MTRAARGLTLLEVLLAVALLTAATTGTSWLLRTATLRARTTSEVLHEQAALDALLAAIERDLMVGDAGASATPGSGAAARVAVAERSLRIATRAAAGSPHRGAIVRELSFRPASGELVSAEEPVPRKSGSPAARPPRVVLGSVAAFSATIDATGSAELLAVEIELGCGRRVRREWPLP